MNSDNPSAWQFVACVEESKNSRDQLAHSTSICRFVTISIDMCVINGLKLHFFALSLEHNINDGMFYFRLLVVQSRQLTTNDRLTECQVSMTS